MSQINVLKRIVLPLYCCIILPYCVSAQNAVTSGRLYVEPPTLICLGFEWYIGGDDNRNASVEVAYRKAGDPGWKTGMPLIRIGDEMAGIAELTYRTPRLFAGSIIDLEPDTEYECRLTLSDPDGVELGPAVHILRIKTRAEPQAKANGRIRHVYPPDWKGEKETPAYEGLMHAYYGFRRYADHNQTVDPVQPGDMILLHAGTYKADRYNYRNEHALTFHGTYSLTHDGTPERPIVIKAAGDGEVIFDGDGAYRLFDLMAADYHHLEGLTIRNADIGILAGEKNVLGCEGLVVKNCRIENVGIGIMAQYRGCRNFYLADNHITGRVDTTRLLRKERGPDGKLQQRAYSYYGVKVYGQGHVICHNYVAYFFDGIDICTHGAAELQEDERSVAIDVYNNDIFLTNDNFFEADGGTYNLRFLRNRGFNSAQSGFTNQPVLGGPVYWIRNIGYNIPEKPALKYWETRPGAIFAYHNVFTTYSGRSWKGMNNAQFRNNLFLQPDDAPQPTLGMKTYTSYTTSDYNGYRFHDGQEAPISWHAPKPGVLRDYVLSHEASTFQTLEDLAAATGQEQHGITVDFSDFVKVPVPNFKAWQAANPDPDAEAFPIWYPEGMDFHLRPGSKAIDAGVRIPNVNDDFMGEAPDMGALEGNRPAPHYGPRN
ncbi:MAG: hypothetical protein RIC19_09060 [Phaeodactylibacter sp.]|uniref:hypothetical protein n=1 Tax=Phaeodactylibacter sp. TaxID=1940289 RepID=UPI0032ECA532